MEGGFVMHNFNLHIDLHGAQNITAEAKSVCGANWVRLEHDNACLVMFFESKAQADAIANAFNSIRG